MGFGEVVIGSNFYTINCKNQIELGCDYFYLFKLKFYLVSWFFERNVQVLIYYHFYIGPSIYMTFVGPRGNQIYDLPQDTRALVTYSVRGFIHLVL